MSETGDAAASEAKAPLKKTSAVSNLPPPSETNTSKPGFKPKKKWPPEPDSPAAKPASEAPADPVSQKKSVAGSMLAPLQKTGSSKSLLKSPAASAAPTNNADPSSPITMSRQGSTATIAKGPGDTKLEASMKNGEASISVSFPGQGKTPILSRANSQVGKEPGTPAAIPPAAGSTAGSQPALSRQGSMQASVHGSAVEGVEGAVGSQMGSRKGSAISATAAGSQRATPVASRAASIVHEEEDELAGVDWRLTASNANRALENAKAELAKEKAKNEELRTENNSLNSKVDSLEEQVKSLMAAPSGKGGDDSMAKGLKVMVDAKDKKISELEAKVRTLESRKSLGTPRESVVRKEDSAAKDNIIAELRSQLQVVRDEQLSRSNNQAHLIEELRVVIQAKDVSLQEHKAAILQLESKLKQAQEAIVSATDYGWENDIKLAQARRALVSILDHHSPGRIRMSMSPGRQASADRERAEEERRKKEEEERLHQQIGELEEAKRLAVDAEDYAAAQTIQAELLRLKETLTSSVSARPLQIAAKETSQPRSHPRHFTVDTTTGYRNGRGAG